MRKIYSCLAALMMMFIAVAPAKAQGESIDVFVSRGEKITSVSDLTVGEHKLVFYNTGRSGYLFDNGVSDGIRLMNFIDSNIVKYNGYVWTINVTENDGTTATVSSVKGLNSEAYMKNLISGKNISLDASTDSAASFTITESDGNFLIFNSATQLYFNGNAISNNYEGSTERKYGYFTGWAASGGNSLYAMWKANTESRTYYPMSYTLTDNSTLAIDTIINVMIGDTAPVPSLTNYTPISFEDGEGVLREGDEMYTYVPTAEGFVTVTYEAWPTITFKCSTNDGKIVDSTFVVRAAKGDTVTLPTIGKLYKLSDASSEAYTNYIASEDITIELTYNYTLPFVPTTITNGQFATDTKWYAMKVRNARYAAYQEGVTDMGYKSADALSLADSIYWAFVDEGDGSFRIYNKAAGPTKILYGGLPSSTAGDYPLLVEESAIPADSLNRSFVLGDSKSTAAVGYTWKLINSDMAYLNDINSSSRRITGFWNSSSAVSDGGSSYAFYLYDDVAYSIDTARISTILLNAQLYLRAEGVVNGWTSDQLSNMATAYEAKDTAAINAAAAALDAATRIAFDANQTYAIESAYIGYIGTNKTKAIYSTENDTVKYAAWKEYVASPNEEFGWKITKLADGGDSLVYIQSTYSNAYMGAYMWGGLDTLSTEINDSSDYIMFESTAAPASYHFRVEYTKPTTNATTGEVTYSLEGGALSLVQGSSAPTVEEDAVKTYKAYHSRTITNYWYLRPITITAINSAAVSGSENADTNVYYDLQGRRVANPTKGGIYVTKGKKVVVQ